MISTTKANTTEKISTSCQRDALRDIPQEVGVGELEGSVVVGVTGVELAETDVVSTLEKVLPVLLLMLLTLLGTPRRPDSVLFAMIFEVVRAELPLLPWLAVTEGVRTEAT